MMYNQFRLNAHHLHIFHIFMVFLHSLNKLFFLKKNIPASKKLELIEPNDRLTNRSLFFFCEVKYIF